MSRINWLAYGARHGYDIIQITARLDRSALGPARPPAWQKMPGAAAALGAAISAHRLAGLVPLYPRLTTGGILVIDDNGMLQGARIATDEYVRDYHPPIFLARLDESVRLAIKP